ncbi:MAG: hypothetical protein M0R17_04470 [Candidatus Omnitrophica bacterium]|jgi:hypothetical protein|nr:hypothetical protein [Candidatus Omnitrophota bacterium]
MAVIKTKDICDFDKDMWERFNLDVGIIQLKIDKLNKQIGICSYCGCKLVPNSKSNKCECCGAPY